MAATMKDVEHIAKLAKLSFSEEEKAKFNEQFNEILAFMEKLNELDTTNVEPLSHVIELQNVLREDVVRESLPTAEALKNAPAHTDRFFEVPKVIDR